jgi:hypothetical protein
VKRTVKSKKIKEAAKVTASALIRKVMEQEMEPEVVINDYMDGEDDDLFVDAGCEDGDEICMQDDSILDPSIEVPSMNDGDEYGMEDDEIPAEEEDLIIPPEEEPMPEAEDEPPAMDDEEDDEVIEPSEKCKQKHGN